MREVWRREIGWEEVGRRENFVVEKGAEKSVGNERGCVFGSYQNDLNVLILNWCTGGCWFIRTKH